MNWGCASPSAGHDRICQLMWLPAGAILFFDDLPENVHAAEDAGFQAVLVRSPDDVAAALGSRGLVPRIGAGWRRCRKSITPCPGAGGQTGLSCC